MIMVCPKCGAEFQIHSNNSAADYIISKYNDIDTVCGRPIELLCACKTPLSTYHDYLKTSHELSIEEAESLIIDYLLNESLKSYQYKRNQQRN